MSLNIPERRRFASNKYTRIRPGSPTIVQIIEENVVILGKHWLTDGGGSRFSIRCPGVRECPICQRNREIGFNTEHPDYKRLQSRYRINVVNLTPVKKCPECGAIYSVDSEVVACSVDGCSADLSGVEVAPMNEVQILERGPGLFDSFKAFDGIPHPMTGEVLPIQSYPFMLVATGKGMQMKITLIPQAPNDLDIDSYEKFDLNEGVILTMEEIQHLLGGGSYKDVMAARTAEALAEETVEPVAVETSEEIPF